MASPPLPMIYSGVVFIDMAPASGGELFARIGSYQSEPVQVDENGFYQVLKVGPLDDREGQLTTFHYVINQTILQADQTIAHEPGGTPLFNFALTFPEENGGGSQTRLERVCQELLEVRRRIDRIIEAMGCEESV